MVPNFIKAQTAVDPEWTITNWHRVKQIMLRENALDRKTKEIIAMVVSMMNNCQYCHLAHKTMAIMAGTTEEELHDAIKVMELFQSFTAIADSLEVPCDVTPHMTRESNQNEGCKIHPCGLRSAGFGTGPCYPLDGMLSLSG